MINDNEFLKACQRDGVTMDDICKEFGIARHKVYSTRTRLKRDGHEFPAFTSSKPGRVISQKAGVRDKDTPFVAAVKPWDIVKRHFGVVRVKRCPSRGFLLDGRPVSVQHLMKEAGAI